MISHDLPTREMSGTVQDLLTFDSWIIFVNKVTLNQLDGQTRLSNTTTSDDDQLVFSQELANRRLAGLSGNGPEMDFFFCTAPWMMDLTFEAMIKKYGW